MDNQKNFEPKLPNELQSSLLRGSEDLQSESHPARPAQESQANIVSPLNLQNVDQNIQSHK